MKTVASWTASVLVGLLSWTAPALAQTWTQSSAPPATWSSVTSSADGNKLVAVVDGGGIYASPDAGSSWTRSEAPNINWASVASSADGSKVVAVIGGGIPFISFGPPGP